MKFRLTFVFLILGIALAVLGGKGLVTSVMPAKYLYDADCDWSKLKKGQRVYVDLDYVWDWYEESTSDGNSVSRLYAVPETRYDGNENKTYFLSITARANEYSQFDKLAEDSYDYDMGEYEQLGERGYIPYDGYLRKMDDEELGFLNNYLKECGFTETEINDMVIPLKIVRNQTLLTNVLMFVGGIVLTILGGVFGFIFFIKKGGN